MVNRRRKKYDFTLSQKEFRELKILLSSEARYNNNRSSLIGTLIHERYLLIEDKISFLKEKIKLNQLKVDEIMIENQSFYELLQKEKKKK